MSSLLWFPINVLQAIFGLLWSMFWILAALVMRVITRGTRIPLIMARRCWAPGLMAVGGVRTEVLGLDNLDPARPCFYASNHQSILDIAVLYAVLPAPLLFVTKEEFRHTPFLGWYMSAMGMIFIRRARLRQSLEDLRQCRRRLAAGNSILIFPEGTRSRDGRLQRLKTGAFIPAIDTDAPVVPVFLDGPGKILPPGGFRPRPGKIRVIVGRPIETSGLEREDRRQLAQAVREQMVELATIPGP